MKKHRTRRRNSYGVKRPRRQKTFADVTKLEGTEYYQDSEGFTFRVEDQAYDQMKTMGELLAKCYNINEGQNPLVMKLVEEPSKLIRGEKIWQVVLRGNFYCVIEPNQSTGGPHSCKLWFQTFGDKKNYWLASMQIMAFFFNEEHMRQAIIDAIDKREFFMLPANEEVPIVVF